MHLSCGRPQRLRTDTGRELVAALSAVHVQDGRPWLVAELRALDGRHAQLATLTERTRVRFYVTAAVLTLIGIFAMRWNVVIGGQLFSKSFLGYTTYKVGFATREGLLPALLVLLLPLGILAVLVKLLPPWTSAETPS